MIQAQEGKIQKPQESKPITKDSMKKLSLHGEKLSPTKDQMVFNQWDSPGKLIQNNMGIKKSLLSSSRKKNTTVDTPEFL